MKNLFLGVALAGLALVSCQNTSNQSMDAADSPAVCPMTGTACDMDMGACEAAGACEMGGEMKSDCCGNCEGEAKAVECADCAAGTCTDCE